MADQLRGFDFENMSDPVQGPIGRILPAGFQGRPPTPITPIGPSGRVDAESLGFSERTYFFSQGPEGGSLTDHPGHDRPVFQSPKRKL